MNGNIRVGSLFGIPFYINPSWFFILGLVTLSYGGELARFPQLSGLTPWLLGLVAALLLFASVVAHELGHSLVALSQGIGVNSITLFLFGGLASLEKESETPLQAFLIAIAGPMVSLILFGLFTIVSGNLSLPEPLIAILSLLGSINLALAVFNMIPGLPLDGGNVLKALVWKLTGNPNKGIIFASRFGQFFGWLAIGVGVLSLFNIIQFGSVWTILIGVFLLQNAGFSAQSAQVQETLSDLTAEDAIVPETPLVNSELTLREFANNYVIGQTEWTQFLVVDDFGKLQGVISVEALKEISTSQWNEIQVKALAKPLQTVETVLIHQSLLDVINLLEREKLSQLAVIDETGVAVGLLEKNSIVNALRRKGEANRG